MAKTTGLGWTTCSVDDASNSQQAIVNDVNDLALTTPRAVIDVTGIDKFAMERLLGLADLTVTLHGTFNAAANMSHAVLSTIPLSTSPPRLITLVTNGKTLAPTCVLTDYAVTRATGGALTWAVPGALSNGVSPTWS